MHSCRNKLHGITEPAKEPPVAGLLKRTARRLSLLAPFLHECFLGAAVPSLAGQRAAPAVKHIRMPAGRDTVVFIVCTHRSCVSYSA